MADARHTAARQYAHPVAGLEFLVPRLGYRDQPAVVEFNGDFRGGLAGCGFFDGRARYSSSHGAQHGAYRTALAAADIAAADAAHYRSRCRADGRFGAFDQHLAPAFHGGYAHILDLPRLVAAVSRAGHPGSAARKGDDSQ